MRFEYTRKAVDLPRVALSNEAVTQPPIAPGKVKCPPPPWDAAFPGAFFCADEVRRNCWRIQKTPTCAPGGRRIPSTLVESPIGSGTARNRTAPGMNPG